MKLLRVKANHFKNCADGYTIDFVARSRKTSEDKEYELQEIAPELYVYNTMAFIGKNASGKTSAIELLDCAYSILGGFRIESKHYSFDGIELEIIFYDDGMIYLYETTLESDRLSNHALFRDEKVYQKKYYKTNLKDLYKRETFVEVPKEYFPIIPIRAYDIDIETGRQWLPEDTSKLFFIIGKKATRAIYFDSYESGADTYRLVFNALKNYGIDLKTLSSILRVFDENIDSFDMLDENTYKISFKGRKKVLSDTQLVYMLSSGTTKGMLLYLLVVASLKEGFDLIIDEVENHFHKTLVENMISLYKDKSVNKKNATLIFSTHYCEVIDQMGRQDNVWICKSGKQVSLSNMYSDYHIRPELLKSKQYYNNAFQTAVDYDALMNLKRVLKK